MVRATLIVGNGRMKRISSSKRGEETYIWREFYTERLHKTHRIKLTVSVAQYAETYISNIYTNECLFASLTGMNHFGTTTDVKGLCEYSRRQIIESVCFRIRISSGCY